MPKTFYDDDYMDEFDDYDDNDDDLLNGYEKEEGEEEEEEEDHSAEIEEETRNFFEEDAIYKDEKEIMKMYHEGKDIIDTVLPELQKILDITKDKLPASISPLQKPKGVDEEEFKWLATTYNKGITLVNQAKSDMIAKLDKFIYYVMENRFNTFKDRYSKDLYQEGVVGILRGIDAYSPEISKPTTFFYRYILHEMTEFVNTNINKTTSHYAGNINKVKRAINHFERSGREWTIKDIAQETGISAETITQALNIMNSANEMHYETADYLDEQMTQRTPSPEEEFMKSEDARLVHEAVEALPTDEANVVKLKYGLTGGEPMSYKNIANELGIQIDKVKKLNNSAIRKLKKSRIIGGNFKNLQREEKALNGSFIGLVPKEVTEKIDKDLDAAVMNNADEIEYEVIVEDDDF